MKRDLTWGGEHMIQYIDDLLQNGKPETYIIFLTNINPQNSIEINSCGTFTQQNTTGP